MSLELDTVSYALISSIVGAAALLSIRNSKSPDIHPLLLNTQSDVSRLRHPEESAVYRSRMYPMGTPLCSTFDRSIRTLADLYKLAGGGGSAAGLDKHAEEEFLLANATTNDYLSYGAVSKKLKPIYHGLRTTAQLVPGNDTHSFVGLYGRHSHYTTITEIACHSHGLVTLPIAYNAPSSHVSHVLQKALLQCLLIDEDLLDRVLALINGGNKGALKQIVVLPSSKTYTVTNEKKQLAKENGVDIMTFDELEEHGAAAAAAAAATASDKMDERVIAPTDIASIYFTSSIRKDAKHGVVLTHKNLLSSIASYLLVIPPQQRFTTKDRLLLSLPLDNVFGHVLATAVSVMGGSIAFLGDDEAEDVFTSDKKSMVAHLKPTLLASGPAFLQQAKQWIESHYGTSFLFKRGYNVKKAFLEDGRLVSDCKYDMLVFRAIRQTLFGGNLRLIYIDNDDSTDTDLAMFLRIVLCTQVLQAFNMTETTSSIVASMFYDYNADPEAKGAPLPCNEIKLVDVPEMNLTAEDMPNPRGEIWVRGNNVLTTYYNDIDSSVTSDVLGSDGWLMTGYLGEMLPNGTVKVIGRKH
ncbi:AMP-dependent synthetase/ligase [Mycotypha africana]|uniref:AMP-dependent synthetase/ligase n=1 Tax=Mycotypha africana TaxID=64632 RepID=UPI00230034D3|nr:AMP-dependent synthetase/ligase [Mycotypha africana]KAI8987960.1 AMP-dependent synthetase/ligase [Mycotypha africana]